MFESFTNNLNSILEKLRGKAVISDDDFDSAMHDIKIALFEADVSVPVAKDFISNIKNIVIGEKTVKGIPPGQMIVKMVQDELIKVLGSEKSGINFNTKGLTVIMMVGLQGAGKTTTTAKLALKLKKNKKVMLASTDVYRPAAQEQLEILGKQIEVETLPILSGQKPLEIVQRAINHSEEGGYDVLILDTAGRLHIDANMMEELKTIKENINPIEIILVADSMIGQDSVNVAKNFNEALGITGIILTRIDGDSRGGAALSMKMTANCPIKFLANGEKLADLEDFYPDRIAQRILNMGDVVSLVEKATEIAGQEEIDKLQEKVKKGKFDLEDLLAQLKTLKKMGGITSILKFIPNIGGFKDQIGGGLFDESKVQKYIAIINSMTKKEKAFPKIINGMRKSRIARGAGVKPNDVSMLIKQYNQMSGVVNQFSQVDQSKFKESDLMNLFKSTRR